MDDIRHFKDYLTYLPLPCKHLISMRESWIKLVELLSKNVLLLNWASTTHYNNSQITEKTQVSVKLLEISCIKNSLSGRGCCEEGKEMQEKTDEYLTTEAIDLDRLENKSKTWKWASDFTMEVPVKYSCSHPQKTQPQYTANMCVPVLATALLH